jgi:nicotinamide riboside kinase
MTDDVYLKYSHEFLMALTGDLIIELAEETGLNYIDACIEYCDQNEFDYEDIAKVVESHQVLHNLIQEDAQRLNFIATENATTIRYE